MEMTRPPNTRPVRTQRIRGAASVTLGRAGLRDLRQSGSAKAMLPRTDADHPEVVFLNTAGGVTSGDRLDYALRLGPGSRATAATQTAERAYRAPDGPGIVRTVIELGAGARLDWLPQEVILFEGANLRRETEVALTGDAAFLGCEMLVLGRAAHGETVAAARLDDRRTVTCDGRLVHEEHLALGLDALADPAARGDARAFATLVLVARGAEDALAALRAALPTDGAVRASASGWDGRLVARFMSSDAAPLRRALVSAIVTLRGSPMPRVWQHDG